MLQIQLICIGKTNESYVKDGIDKYLKLLGKYCKPNLIELNDVKNANKLPPDKLKEEEAKLLQQHLSEKSLVLFLDETGKTMDSPKFAQYLEKKSLESSTIVFVIGGSYG
ncbi:MAG: 23S rRNA (pseudouridine(1915)-N(3))-methyltransferase RlmH, partial [Bacteroidetes bacterium]|nr:23S rRNA (pseudouridine(1915)-N(3))-methyltransferase RlmH [Bacteroidota bacterium]